MYAAFRPTYPEELYQFIFQHVPQKTGAWDCGTGNGQVAQRLALDFDQVFASDISEKQLAHAPVIPNVFYSVTPAEYTHFKDNTFDLITVGQALHWFDVDKFCKEVRRVSRKNAVAAFWGYGNVEVNEDLDPIISNFYSKVVGPYWDDARKHVENEYLDLPFPFERINAPKFSIEKKWTIGQFAGYFESWSATQKYIQENQRNPVTILKEKLLAKWGPEETVTVRFPLCPPRKNLISLKQLCDRVTDAAIWKRDTQQCRDRRC